MRNEQPDLLEDRYKLLQDQLAGGPQSVRAG